MPLSPQDKDELRRIFVEKGKKFTQLITSIIGWANISGKPSTFPPENHTHLSEDITDLVWRIPILAISNEGTATANNRYIVGDTPTGIFSALTTNDIVEYNGSTWESVTPVQGWAVYNKDDDSVYTFDGSDWNVLSGGGGSYVGLTGDETVAGVKTFSSFPVTPSSAPSSDYQVANKKYVDDNAGGGGGGFWTVVPKTSDEFRTSDNSLTDDTDLQIPVLSGQSYMFEFKLLVKFHGAPDFKFIIYNTGGYTKAQYSVLDYQLTSTGVANTYFIFLTTLGTQVNLSQSSSTTTYWADVIVRGFFTANSDGTFSIRWGQQTSNATYEVGLMAGSLLQYKQV